MVPPLSALSLALCREARCFLTPYNEISMWKNAIIPHMEAQYKTSIWKNAIIPHMEAQYKTRV